MTSQAKTVGLLLVLLLVWGLAACSRAAAPTPIPVAGAGGAPSLAPLSLAEGEKLQVVATTSIIADVVGQVGGDALDLVTLLPLGADPHAYTATPQDLRTLNQADVIFINGLGLEEALLPVLSAGTAAPVVSVNVAVEPHVMGNAEESGQDDDSHVHEGGDPHTWLDVANVILWTETIRDTLSTLDPARALEYAAAAEEYTATLTDLDQELRARVETLPQVRRKLVSDHAEFGYFARAYGFELIGAVVPALSTMAAPSAQELAGLQDQIRATGVPAIFVSSTVNPQMAAQLAHDLGIQVVTLYTASLSAPEGEASTYVDLMRAMMESIVTALGSE